MSLLDTLRNAAVHPAERRLRAPLRLTAGAIAFAVLLVGAQLLVLLALGGSADPDSAVVLGTATVASGLVLTVALVPVARYVDRRRPADYGFRLDRDWWVDCGFGLALGVALQAAIFLVGWAAGWYTVTDTFVAGGSFLLGFAGLLALFLVVGVYEEALARGWLLTNVAEGLRFAGERAAVVGALVASSVLFGLLHAANPGITPFSLAVITLAGVMLAAGYLLTGELAIPIGLHVTWNLAQGAVFGHGVSGLGVETSVLAVESTGPAAWTGGAFGPEGGYLGLLAVVAGTLAVVGWCRLRGADEWVHPAITTPELVDDGDGIDEATAGES
ncbi:hypothetical protein JCM17823_18440 [Halorubrum gandharaense]